MSWHRMACMACHGMASWDDAVANLMPTPLWFSSTHPSALTGEVHPIAKIPLDPADSHRTYHPKTHKSSTISAGTTILECGEGQTIEDADLAIVTQTGSFTAKGELLCDVLSYERHKFKFDTEVQLILFILCVEAAVMLSVVFSVLKDHWCYSWFYAM